MHLLTELGKLSLKIRRSSLDNRAGVSPPSLTTGARRLYIYIYLFIYLFILYIRPFWPPGGPALRANVAGRTGVESDYSCYYAIYILVVRICQTSKVRTKADTAMNSDLESATVAVLFKDLTNDTKSVVVLLPHY